MQEEDKGRLFAEFCILRGRINYIITINPWTQPFPDPVTSTGELASIVQPNSQWLLGREFMGIGQAELNLRARVVLLIFIQMGQPVSFTTTTNLGKHC